MLKMNIVDIHSESFRLYESVPTVYVVPESATVPSHVTALTDPKSQNFLHGYIRVGSQLERGLMLARLVACYVGSTIVTEKIQSA